MKKFYYTAPLLLSFFLSGCMRDLDVPHQDQQRKIVLNTIIEEGEKIKCHVSQTSLFGDMQEEGKFTNFHRIGSYNFALYNNDEGVYSEDNVSYEWFDIDHQPKAGDRIKIQISSPPMPSIKAEGVIPRKVAISRNCWVEEKEGTPEETKGWDSTTGEEYSLMKYFKDLTIYIPFQDIAGEDNYYRIAVDMVNKYEGEDYSHTEYERVEVEDPILEKGGASSILFGNSVPMGLFRDTKFQDKEYLFKVKCRVPYKKVPDRFPGGDNSLKKEVTILVTRFHLSRDLFFFWKSVEATLSGGRNPFSEPVKIYNNIQGGCGILGTMARTREVIEHKLSL